MTPITYNVDLKWLSDRKGEISSPALKDKVEVATPPEFPKGMEGIWSPEHLYTASVLSCFMTTFLAVAENSNLQFTEFDCASKGILDKVEGKFLMTEIILEPTLILKNSEDIQKAEKILDKSERACLITNSINTKVSMKPDLKVLESIQK